jgi:hypothetical protein
LEGKQRQAFSSIHPGYYFGGPSNQAAIFQLNPSSKQIAQLIQFRYKSPLSNQITETIRQTEKPSACRQKDASSML